MSDQLRVLSRRKWIVLVTALAVPAAAVLFSLRQPTLYEAKATVLVDSQNRAASLAGIDDPSNWQDAERLVKTQAKLARKPEVTKRVVEALGVRKDLASDADVSADPDANVLDFRVRDEDPALAVRFATEYANQFVSYRKETDKALVRAAREQLEKRLRQLRAVGAGDSQIYENLLEKDQDLRTLEVLTTSNVSVLHRPARAWKVQPRPVRNGLLGLVLGLTLGLGLAIVAEALDTRIRSADEIEERLGVPLLARVPKPPHRVKRRDRLVMVARRDSEQAEAFRMLRTNLEFVNLDRGHRAIMFTSALEKEGKSTTVANLAVALASTGRHIVLVDLDLRRPFLDRFFDLEDTPGVTDVALGRVALEQAIVPVAITDDKDRPGARASGNGRGDVDGTLRVLTAGPAPPDVGEFVATRTLGRILSEVREHADLVLVDAPPLLAVGDAMALSANVDALVVVIRLESARRPILNELRRVLDASPTAKLGFVLTGAEREERYGYGYAGYGTYEHSEREVARR